MARIPMGEFGQAVNQSRPTQTPTAAQLDGGLSDAVQRVGNTAAAIGQNAMDQQAAEAKRQQLQDEAEAKHLRNEADKAKAIVVLNSTKDQLSDLHDEYVQGVLSGTLDKTKAEGEWSSKALSLIEQANPNMPEAHRGVLAAELKANADRLGNSIRKNVTLRDRQDVTAGITQTLEFLQRQYSQDPEGVTKKAMLTIESLGPNSTLSPDQLQKMGQKFKEDAQFTTAFELVTTARNDRKGLDSAEKTIQGMTDIDPQKRAVLLDRVSVQRLALDQKAELAAQRAQRQAEAHLRQAEAAATSFQMIADKGGIIDPAETDKALRATQGTPFQSVIRAAAQQAASTGGLAAQPVSAQRAALDAINSEIATKGLSEARLKRREQIQKVVDASESDYNKDGLRAANERGVIETIAPLDLTSGAAGISKSIGARIQQAQVASVAAGKPVSPLLPEEADMFGKLIRKLPEEARAEAVSQLAQQMPAGMRVAFAQQVGKSDKGLGLAMRMGGERTTEGRATATLIFKGEQVIKDKAVKEDNAAVTGIRAKAAEAIGDAFAGEDRNDVLDAAVRIYYGAQSEGQSIDAARAVRLAVGGNVLEHNGRKVVVPAGVDESALGRRLQSISVSEIESQSGKTVRAAGVEIPVADFVKSIPGQQLIAIRPGKFAVVVGGRPVTNSQGKPIVIGVN